jgi:hypothetical protein
MSSLVKWTFLGMGHVFDLGMTSTRGLTAKCKYNLSLNLRQEPQGVYVGTPSLLGGGGLNYLTTFYF